MGIIRWPARGLHRRVETSMADKTEEKKPLKICCACPETRKPRDECIAANGQDKCFDLIVVSISWPDAKDDGGLCVSSVGGTLCFAHARAVSHLTNNTLPGP